MTTFTATRLLSGFGRAVACAETGVTSISPSVGRVRNHDIITIELPTQGRSI